LSVFGCWQAEAPNNYQPSTNNPIADGLNNNLQALLYPADFLAGSVQWPVLSLVWAVLNLKFTF